ncbi:DUF6508 domain-containing protein [Paracoccus sphaerophysae]|uniref:DUF6508 domain-containing protein n=1 Tax=Paracoccus sphaerophysae TaxID=690417 RepID=UPI00069075AC|nr:DUF6508 domain-containing protein [Paracoccus sphaerophysae]
MADQEPITREGLSALAAFLPSIRAPDFSSGTWKGGEQQADGSIQMPWFAQSDAISDFVKAAYDLDWVRSFDWPEWTQTEEAFRLRNDPEALAGATADQLAKLLTVVIRQDRFAEGSLAEAFDNGLILSILERAKVLSDAANERRP